MVSCISGRSRLLAIHSQLPRPGLSTLLLHLTLVLSLGLSFGSQTQHSTLTLTNRDVSQVGKCMAEVPIHWAEYSPSCLPQTCCYSPFLSSQTPPPSNTLCLLLRRLPKVWETFLLHNSFPSVLVPSWSLLFLFWRLLGLLSVLSSCFSMNLSTCRCIFNVSVKRGELCFLLLCHLDPDSLIKYDFLYHRSHNKHKEEVSIVYSSCMSPLSTLCYSVTVSSYAV